MTKYHLSVGDENPGQMAFWSSDADVRAYVGGVGSGKTFAGALEVLRMPPSTRGMVVAPTYKMLRDATQATFFEVCPPSLVTSHNKTDNHTILGNGVEILWRSADAPDSLRGPNLNWAWGDEWAFVSEAAHKILVGRLRRDPARLWLTTTPNGMNWFHDWCVGKNLGYAVFNGKTFDNKHNSAGYLDALLAQYADDPEFMAQELEGAWVDLGNSRRFPPQLVDAISAPRFPLDMSPPPVQWDGQTFAVPLNCLEVYAPPAPGRTYLWGADPAEGLRGGDDSALVLEDSDTGEIACILAGEMEPRRVFPAAIASVSRWYNHAQGVVERNNHGHAVIAGLESLGVFVLAGRDGRPGWQTTAASKADAASGAYAAMVAAKERGLQIFPQGHRLPRQVKSIERMTLSAPGKRKGAAKVDDLAMAWQMCEIARGNGASADWLLRMVGQR